MSLSGSLVIHEIINVVHFMFNELLKFIDRKNMYTLGSVLYMPAMTSK